MYVHSSEKQIINWPRFQHYQIWRHSGKSRFEMKRAHSRIYGEDLSVTLCKNNDKTFKMATSIIISNTIFTRHHSDSKFIAQGLIGTITMASFHAQAIALIHKESIRPFYKARAPVRLRLPVTQESTKSLKALLVLHANTFELTKPSIMQVIILKQIDL